MGNSPRFQLITSLTLFSCLRLSDGNLEAIGIGCPCVKHLCPDRTCYISDFGLFTFCQHYTNLKSLDLKLCLGISFVGVLYAICKSHSKLRSLSIEKCISVRDSALISYHMLTPCRTLHSLSVKECVGFGIVCLTELGKICSMLQHVELRELSHLTDDGIHSFLASRQARFVKVNLGDSANLTDRAVAAIASQHGVALKALNLNFCSMITDVSLLAIARNCLLLEDLNLMLSHVTDTSIAALACQKQLKLKVLNLAGCRQITDECIPFLSLLGQSLEVLSLLGCTSVSDQQIRSLVPVLPNCKILYNKAFVQGKN